MLDDKDRILLVKHTPQGRWVLPWGHVEQGETLSAALRRELYEEFGLQIYIYGAENETTDREVNMHPMPISVHEVMYQHQQSEEKVQKLEFRYFAGAKDKEDLSVDANEIYEYEWMEIDDILNLDGSNDCHQSLLDILEQNRDLLDLVR